jgi:hypothetical protein
MQADVRWVSRREARFFDCEALCCDFHIAAPCFYLDYGRIYFSFCNNALLCQAQSDTPLMIESQKFFL